MTGNDPFSISEMFRAFAPDEIAKMFDPAALLAGFRPGAAMPANLRELAESQRRDFDAMVVANAAGYRGQLERQMQILEDMTAAAQKQLEVTANAGSATPDEMAAAYRAAVEQALDLMRQLAESSRRANDQVFNAMMDKLAEAISRANPA